MFRKIVKNKIMCVIRSKGTIFWLLFFPIILSVLFYAGLSGMLNGENFEPIKVGLVKNEYSENSIISKIIKTVSVENEADITKDTLFILSYISEEQGKTLLEDSKISGYIYFDTTSHLVVKENGMNQTIIKKFLDIAEQRSAIISEIVKDNKGQIPENIQNILLEDKSYIIDTTHTKNKPDTIVQFFYSILGMTCMYGATLGCYSIYYLQQNQSSIAKRLSISPVSKMKQLISSFIADGLISICIILIVLMFISKVLGVNFGDRYVLTGLTSIVGSVMGLSFGYFLGAITRCGINVKCNIVVGVTMLCSFLAGMMDNSVKYIIKKKAFIIDRINPVNLITESYYKLYYYTKLDKFYENILILTAFSIVLIALTLFILNRQEKSYT